MDQARLQELIDQGKLEEAGTTLQAERADAVARGDSHAAALSANDLGAVYSLARKFDLAYDTLMEAQRGFIASHDEEGQARASGNLARVQMRRGEMDAAAALLLQAADLFHATTQFQEEYATLRLLSRVYTGRGNFWQGIAMMDRALSVKPNRSLIDTIQQFFYRLPLRLMGM